MTDENLPKKSDDNFDLAATFHAGDQNLASLATIKHLHSTNETEYSKNQKDKASPTHGEILLGRFRVQKILGEGSFGKVYLAKDDQLSRLVVIKISKEISHDKKANG